MSDETPKILWEPSAERIERSTLTRYQAWLERERGLRFDDYAALWEWSTSELDAFWETIVEFFGIEFSTQPEAVLGRREMPGTQWFPGARLSFARATLSRQARRGDRDPPRVGVARARQRGRGASCERRRLRSRPVCARSGSAKDDRVVAYMPNIPETVAAFLACASIGAVWSSAAPEFGARSVIDRFAQVEPKVLLAIDGYRYGGKDFDRRSIVEAIAAEIPSLQRVVRFGYLDGSGWEEGFTHDGELTFAQLPFDHPLWVLYSSGTTGLPKPIVHGHGGILLEQVKKMNLHIDAQAGDRIFWFSTTGWMMWNFLVGVLVTDASVVLFDGNPGYPSLDTLWELAADAGITTFGTSAAFIASCMKAEVQPGDGRDLSALRAVGSTGSPLSPEGFRWVYEQLGADTWLFSTSGGTDLCTAFVGGVPTLPVYLGELQARSLGAAVQAFDPDGQPLIDEVGELVITEPMPSMPIFFWGDADGDRLRESYFEMYPGIWRHGDWIEITSRGTAMIYGRSDSTINRGGVRMGTSEIYRAVLDVPEVLDALVVDLPAGRSAGLGVATRDGERAAAGAGADGGCRCSWFSGTARRSTTSLSARSAGGSATTARRVTFRTRSARSRPCRGRCRARCSRCPSSGS